MNIRRRLLVAFVIMLLFPCVMVTAVAGVIMTYQTNSIREVYDIKTDTLHLLIANPTQILNRLTRGVYNDLATVSEKYPERLLDSAYVENLNTLLKEKYSFLIVRREEEILFCGNEKMFEKISGALPEYDAYSTEVDGGLYVSGKVPYLLKQHDFLFQDGSRGSVFIITDVNTTVPELKSTAIQGVVSFLMILLVTALLLLAWFYRGFAKPITVLKKAMNEVKEGNLNFRIVGAPDDEIGELCRDFEEMREHLREQIEVRLQYEQDLRELISNISHDLKTPLTAVQGYAEGLLDGVADTKEKQEKYLRTICTKAGDMTTLVEELSFYTKIDANTIPYHFEPIEISSYFQACLEEMSLDLERKNGRLSFASELEEGQTVLADREQLKRVINNIVGNSLKYLDKEQGEISVMLRSLGDMVQAEMRDNGSGIEEEALPYIFDRFYRGDASRNSGRGGTGLGLAIAKRIIKEHGGTIWVESKLNEGTAIYFTLRKS